MNFASIGTISSYTKNIKLEANWKKRQESNDFTTKLNNAFSELGVGRSILDEHLKQNNNKLQTITNKLNGGKKLTADELEYLRQNNPELYKKAKDIEAEAAKYREELKKCRTKEEVERLKFTYLGEKLASVNSISNNPNIPKGAKMGMMIQINAQVNAVTEEERAFKESAAYRNLETEQERAERIRREQEKLFGIPEETEEPKETGKTEESSDTETPDEVEGTARPEEETTELPGTLPGTDDAHKKTETVPETAGIPETARRHGPAAITFDEYIGQKESSAAVHNEGSGRMSYKNMEVSRPETGTKARLSRKKV